MGPGKEEDNKDIFNLELNEIGKRGLPVTKRQMTGKNKAKEETENVKVSVLDIPSLGTPTPPIYMKPLKKESKEKKTK
jgi:hypothetical protein